MSYNKYQVGKDDARVLLNRANRARDKYLSAHKKPSEKMSKNLFAVSSMNEFHNTRKMLTEKQMDYLQHLIHLIENEIGVK